MRSQGVKSLKGDRLIAYSFLALVFVLLVSGFKVNYMWYSISTALAATYVLFRGYEESHGDPRQIALSSALVALAASSRQLLHGIEFSPVFFITILSGYVFGASCGFTVGALSMFLSNFFLGHGPWTAFQMFGVGLVSALPAYLPKRGRHSFKLLILYCILSAYLYGFFMDFFWWVSFIPTHTPESLLGILSAGMLANTSRAFGNLFFMSIMGPLLLKSLRRFRRRLTYTVK